MLVLSHVSREFSGIRAVDDISLSIASGTTYALLGPNGAGKTTTMRLILGILVPDSGSVTWHGRRIDGAARRRFGYLPEERGLYGKLTVRDQIAYFGQLHGLRGHDLRTRTDAWLERLDIAAFAGRRCAELSKGNQQKVQVACAAVHEPDFLMLDEPFSGLDPVNAATLLGVLREFQGPGRTLVLSSHQMWQVEDLCTHVAIIAGGKLRENGALADLRAAWPTRAIEIEPDTPDFAELLAREPGARRRAAPAGTLAFDVRRDIDLPRLARQLANAGDLTRFVRMEPSLQDIYLRAIDATA